MLVNEEFKNFNLAENFQKRIKCAARLLDILVLHSTHANKDPVILDFISQKVTTHTTYIVLYVVRQDFYHRCSRTYCG